MIDRSHLDALQVGLSHERIRLANAKTPLERELRTIWVQQYERQIADEYVFLGIEPPPPVEEMTADEMLAELFGDSQT